MKRNSFFIGLVFLASSASMVIEAQQSPLVQRFVYKEYAPLDSIEGPACRVEMDMDFFIEGASDRFRASVLQVNIKFGARKSLTGNDGREVKTEPLVERVESSRPPKILNLGLVNKVIIEKAFGAEYGRESFLSAAAHFRDAKVQEYRKSVSDLLEKVPDTRLVEHSYYLKGEVLDTGNLFVTYHLVSSVYTGGAHPMTENLYLNFDEEGLLDLERMFGEDKQDVLEKVVFKALLNQEGVKDAKALAEKSYFPDQFHVSENFYVKDGNCVFVYNPYEIAPYSRGVVEIPVPVETLKKKKLWL